MVYHKIDFGPFKMYKRSYRNVSNSIKREVSKVRRIVGNAARVAQKFRMGGVQVATAVEQDGAAGAITQQNDSKMLYKRRRAPRRVRRKMYRKYKSFLAKQLKAVQDNTNLFQLTGTRSSGPDAQAMFSITSGYIRAPTLTNDAVGDLHSFFSNVTSSIVPEDTSLKWYLTGISTDYTIVNATAGGTVELDVYEWVCRKDFNMQGETSVDDFLAVKLDEESLLPGGNNKMGTNSLGYVPTDSNEAMRYIVIKSKQRFYLGQNQAISFTRRIKYFKPKLIMSDDLNHAAPSDGGFLKAGVSRGILVVQKGLPSATNTASDRDWETI